MLSFLVAFVGAGGRYDCYFFFFTALVEVVAYSAGDDFLIANYSWIVSDFPFGIFLIVLEMGRACSAGGGGGGGGGGGRDVLEIFGTALPLVGAALFLLFSFYYFYLFFYCFNLSFYSFYFFFY